MFYVFKYFWLPCSLLIQVLYLILNAKYQLSRLVVWMNEICNIVKGNFRYLGQVYARNMESQWQCKYYQFIVSTSTCQSKTTTTSNLCWSSWHYSLCCQQNKNKICYLFIVTFHYICLGCMANSKTQIRLTKNTDLVFFYNHNQLAVFFY